MSAKIRKVEILPGYSIEVSSLNGKRLNKAALLRSKISDSERRAILETIPVRSNQKYSKQFLDEAVRISRLTSVREAEEITGIKQWSIALRIKELLAMGKLERKKRQHNRPGGRWSPEQKRRCVELALKLMNSKETKRRVVFAVKVPEGEPRKTYLAPKWPQRSAFIEAGKRLGVNGRSIEWQWSKGFIKPYPALRP